MVRGRLVASAWIGVLIEWEILKISVVHTAAVMVGPAVIPIHWFHALHILGPFYPQPIAHVRLETLMLYPVGLCFIQNTL